MSRNLDGMAGPRRLLVPLWARICIRISPPTLAATIRRRGTINGKLQQQLRLCPAYRSKYHTMLDFKGE
ncbi:hypothetical protein VTO42DRAFT_1586 [Malbranchea cinnamomea]